VNDDQPGDPTSAGRPHDDGAELRRFLAGDRERFTQLLHRHQAALLRYAHHRLGDPTAAEDVVQETFVRLLREARTLTDNATLAPWLFRVCRNLCADEARREHRMQQRQLKVAVPDLAAPEPWRLESDEEQSKVRELLAALPDHEREVLTLKVQHGKSYREIQALLGTSLHDVFTTAHQALARMAKGLRAAGLA